MSTNQNHNIYKHHMFTDKLLFRNTDNFWLAVFRMSFGLLMGIHCVMSVLNGQVYHNFTEPPVRFPYIDFGWLSLIPGQAFPVFYIIMAASAFMILAGYRYRLFSIILAALWTITYLSQKVDYNNHYYLMVLISWIMVLVPANQRLSLDVKHGRSRYSKQCPQWVPLLFVSLTAIMYLFAGINKFDPDWLSGRFLEIMFSRFRQHQYLGNLYSNHQFILFISYGGLAFDLLIAPALIWKKTRVAAFFLSCLFHLFNSYTFHIGVFPFLGIALNLLFFIPIHYGTGIKDGHFSSQNIAIPGIDERRKRLLIKSAFTVFLIIQIIIPVRHFFFPGNTFWTDEGYRMSWKMMGRTKSGYVKFKVMHGDSILEINEPSRILSPKHAMWLAGSPDMIWQYAQKIKWEYIASESMEVQVYAVGAVSLNRWPAQPLVDSTVNLAGVKWEPFRHANWILPWKRPE